MPRGGQLRHGSLQFYPRKRADRILPSVNWNSVLETKDKPGLLGFIGYKVGMSSAYVKDNTPNSMTKGKKIIIPVTIIECPTLKIFSVRFYKNKKVVGEILNQSLDKELKRKLKLPNEYRGKIESFKKDFDDLRVIAYTQVKKTGIKKSPDILEIGLAGSKEEKLNFAKENFSREISIKDFLTEDIMKNAVVDIRGVTTGKGNQGTTKRFGTNLRAHKSEKGVRGPGSGGPWHPSRVEFSQPMPGQMGYFTRTVLNNKIILSENISKNNINPEQGFKHYGKIKNDFLILFGSVQGPTKRQLIITPSYRQSKPQSKKNYEFLELR